MLTFISLGLTACGDDDVPAPDGTASDIDAVKSMVVTPCTPDPDYNDCQEVDLDQVRHWTDTLHDPDGPAWRDVQPSSEDELDYEVTINVDKLSGGVISTTRSQGQYQSAKHFKTTISTLLGVDVTTDNFALIVHGSTIKQAEDGGPAPSYGVFLYDALSDEDGKIFIDGVEKNNDFIARHRTHDQSHAIKRNGQLEEAGTQERIILFAFCAILAFNLMACSDDTEIAPSNDTAIQDVADTSYSSADTEVDSGDISESADADVDSGDISEEPDVPETDVPFEKPYDTDVPSGGFGTSDTFCSPRPNPGQTLGWWGEEYMQSTSYMIESWLYVDEYYVQHGFRCDYNRDRFPKKFKVMAFHADNILPLRLVEVLSEDDYPTLEEIESWQPDEFAQSTVVELENDLPFNYTVVVPPWAFPEPGAYNIQILFVPLGTPDEERAFLFDNFRSQRPQTVYYGGESPQMNEDQLRLEPADTEVRDISDIAARFSNFTFGNFLAPPESVYDWTELADPFDANMAVVLESSEPTVTLDLHVFGLDDPEVDTSNENLYIVRQNDEIIDHFVFEPPFLDLSPPMTEPEEITVIPLEVQLTEEMSSIQVFIVPDGHIPYTDEPVPPGMTDSNILLMRYNPDL